MFHQVIDDVPITVEQADNLVTLHFNNGILQSQIDADSALRLPLTGNRMMLAHLMFVDLPASILLAGCGGGAIARWFNAVSPASQGVAIETSQTIIDLARQFFDFPSSDSHWQLRQGDVRHYLAETDRKFDFILFDIEEDTSTPAWMHTIDFLENCRQSLNTKGVITFNIIAASNEALIQALIPIRQVFPDRTCCLSSPENQNIMVIAFNSRPDVGQAHDNARHLSEKLGIEFDSFYRQMLKDNPPGSGIF